MSLTQALILLWPAIWKILIMLVSVIALGFYITRR